MSLLTVVEDTLGKRDTDRNSRSDTGDNLHTEKHLQAGSTDVKKRKKERKQQRTQITVRESTAAKMRMACDILLQR